MIWKKIQNKYIFMFLIIFKQKKNEGETKWRRKMRNVEEQNNITIMNEKWVKIIINNIIL